MGKALSALRSQEEALRRARRFIERAVNRCREAGLEFVASYIVGSRARGDYMADSDIDLVLVVRGARGRNMLERLMLFKEILEPGIDLRVYDVEEWFSGESVWIKEMKKEALKIA